MMIDMYYLCHGSKSTPLENVYNGKYRWWLLYEIVQVESFFVLLVLYLAEYMI